MRITMLEARQSKQSSVYDFTNQPSLANPLLGRIMVQKGHEVQCFAEQLAPIDWDFIAESDLVGITSMTLTVKEAYKLAKTCRHLGKTVVMGGPHVSFMAEEALLEGADFVVRKEGHETFPELVHALEKGETDFSRIPGLSYRSQDGGIVHNKDRPFCTQEQFSKLPAPDIRLIRGWENINSIPVMTQWGCPYNCDFCSVIQMCGRKVKYRSAKSVLDELEHLTRIYDNHGISVFFCSDNFFANKREAKELLEGIIERKLFIQSGVQMRIDTVCNKKLEIDEDLIFLMRKAGVQMVYIGVESVNQKTLDSYNKKLDVEQTKVGVKALSKRGFHVHGMFVFGGADDDKMVFRKTHKFVVETGFATVQYLAKMPLPGTPYAERIKREGRILTEDWSLYNGQFVVTEPENENITAYELQLGIIKALRKFYSSKYTLKLAVKSLPHTLKLLTEHYPLRRNLRRAFLYLLRGRKIEILKVINDRLPNYVKFEMYSIQLPLLRLWARKQVARMRAQTKGHTRFLLKAKN